MQEKTINFSKESSEFYKVLKVRVDDYFKEEKISKFGGVRMQIKSAFMLALYFTPFILMVTGVVTSPWMAIAMWAIMGVGMSGIGLSIMHDANHGAYSKKKSVNNAMGFVLNFIGGYHVNWKIQHNVLHHTFTNIDGYDEDIEKKGIVRFSPTQEKKKLFRLQLLYAPILYAILTLYWFVYKDYDQLADYNKRGLLAGQGLTFRTALRRIIIYKIVYISVTVGLPIFLMDLPWWHVVLGFVLMQSICGLILAIVFQCAHVLETTDFYEADKDGNVENNWAIHQMKTTSNFAVGNMPLTWFIGGLNHQIEHHLFPTVCHVHYPKIATIVKKTALEYDIPYLEHKTFYAAIVSHFTFLHQLGTGKV